MAHRPLASGRQCPLYLKIRGDMGCLTTWTGKRSGMTAMQKEPPKTPCSDRQRAWRKHFANCVAYWNGLTQSERDAYEQVTLKLHFLMTGHDLWMKCALPNRWTDAIRAEELTGIHLHIPPVPP
jgi:hypothetical protein